MPDDTNPSPEAEALARVLWTRSDSVTCCKPPWPEMVTLAQRAIDAGWTPPDPHFAIARDISALIYPSEEFDPFDGEDEDWDFDAELLAAVRRLDLRRGDQ